MALGKGTATSILILFFFFVVVFLFLFFSFFLNNESKLYTQSRRKTRREKRKTQSRRSHRRHRLRAPFNSGLFADLVVWVLKQQNISKYMTRILAFLGSLKRARNRTDSRPIWISFEEKKKRFQFFFPFILLWNRIAVSHYYYYYSASHYEQGKKSDFEKWFLIKKSNFEEKINGFVGRKFRWNDHRNNHIELQ